MQPTSELPQLPDHSHRRPDAVTEHRRHIRRAVAAVTAGAVVAAGAVVTAGEMTDWGRTGSDAQTHTPHEAGRRDQPAVPPEFGKIQPHSLLGDSWHMLGARYDGATHSMRFSDSGWAVRTIDENGRETGFADNPPQLLVGPRLKTNGQDFGIAGSLSGETPGSAFTMSDEPNVVLDEEVHRAAGIAIRIGNKEPANTKDVIVDVYDGKQNKPVKSHELTPVGSDGRADFWLRKEEGSLTVGSGMRTYHVDANRFNHQIVFGADGNLTLNSLNVYDTGKKPLTIEDTSTRTLPPLAKDGFQAIADAHGRKDLAIVDAVDLTSIDDSLPFLGNIRRLKPEMMGKMQALYRGTPDAEGNIKPEDFDLTQLRALIDLAKRSDRSFDMHTLIWGEAMPKNVEGFLRRCIATGNHKAALNFVAQYTKFVVGATKDDVNTYDVVNEPMGSTDSDATALQPQKHLVYQATGGTQYMDVAIEAAADAGAKRIRINENGLETWDERFAAFMGIAEPIARKLNQTHPRAKLVVGFQMHFEKSDIDEWVNDDAGGKVDPTYVSDDLSARVDQVAAAGMDADFTEVSVDAEKSDVESAEQIQAAVYAGAANAAWRNKHVGSFGLWGFVSNKRYMTTTFNADGSYELGNDTPWDIRGGKIHEKKLVVDGIKAGLSNTIQGY